MRFALLLCSLVCNGKQKVDTRRIRELSSSMPVAMVVFLIVGGPLGTGFLEGIITFLEGIIKAMTVLKDWQFLSLSCKCILRRQSRKE